MSDQSRLFSAGPDPFGRTWKVQFRWLQTAISIRHADTVDVKFLISSDDGSPEEERVIALPQAALLKVTAALGRKLTDSWCMRLAGLHLKHMILTTEDMEKTLVTLSEANISGYASEMDHETVSARR